METECAFYEVNCWVGWATDEVYFGILDLYGSILLGLLSVISSIPVPVWMQNVSTVSLPSGLVYLLDMVNFAEGLAIVVSAYTFRFLLRRVPFFG